MTRAERERRLMNLRADLCSLYATYTDSMFWALFKRFSRRFGMIGACITRVDAMLRFERAESGGHG